MGMNERGREGSVEAESLPETRVVLHVFRHGEKGKPKEGETDLQVRLTPKGREQATAKGKETNPQPEVGVAFGSPRQRAQETAGRVMMAGHERITGDTTLEEMQAMVDEELRYGKKIAEEPRLNFTAEKSLPLGAAIYKAVGDKRLLEFVVQESDQMAKETNDQVDSTYSRMAAQGAELAKKYEVVGRSFQQVVARNPEKYKKLGNQMERYLGTHQSVGESFVAKVLEKTQGVKMRDQFVSAYPNGFSETEGYSLEISRMANGAEAIILKVKIKDTEYSFSVSVKILDEMIEEGKLKPKE